MSGDRKDQKEIEDIRRQLRDRCRETANQRADRR